MLDELHSIVTEVNAASSLGAALRIIVHRVKEAIRADVCSVYLTDFETREHVLQATDGLNPEAVGLVRLPIHRGLIGLVCERAEPINLDDAPAHPRYMFVTETGEVSYRGFLGVPIIQARRVLGVLVARQQVPRRFDDNEVTFLVTLAAQLAGAITLAQASGELASLQAGQAASSRFLEGRAGSNGVGIGRVAVVYPEANLEAVPERSTEDPEADEATLRAAVTAVESDLKALQGSLGESLDMEDKALFDAWLLMLGSDSLVQRTVERIREGDWAPGALRKTIDEHARVFDRMEDVYLRERASDIRDLGRRILMHLQRETPRETEYADETVLVGEDISAVQLAEVPPGKLVAVVSARGSSSSHVAILARAMGVPAVMGVADLPVGRIEGLPAIVDGYRGRIYISPSPAVLDEYKRLAQDESALSAELETLRGEPSQTLDGREVPLYLNTGLVSEMGMVGAEEVAGIGLYRTELPFMIRDRFPGEAVQMMNYRRVLKAFEGRPVVMRTLDIGGDKPLPYFPMDESNPFLGWRGIRVSLDHPEIFITQVRAMLRAAIGFDNLRIMLPMISNVSEVDDGLSLIQRAHEELLEDGYEVSMPSIGVMVEVPSAVYMVDALARRVDFLSIGTNDLTQYLLAVDRNNPSVAGLYDELHPAVLRALVQVVSGAQAYNREVGVCGEMAGNPLAVVLLIGMGVTSLSMSAGSLLRVKRVIRSFSISKARELLRTALRFEEGAPVHRLMEKALEDVGLGGLVRPGK